MRTVEVTAEYYSNILNNMLSKDKRIYIDAIVVAENYYLVFATSGLPVGGFAVDVDELMGVFSLIKGVGSFIIKEARRIVGLSIYVICIDMPLLFFYAKHGFDVVKVIAWDYKLAPKDWVYTKESVPDLYLMRSC